MAVIHLEDSDGCSYVAAAPTVLKHSTSASALFACSRTMGMMADMLGPKAVTAALGLLARGMTAWTKQWKEHAAGTATPVGIPRWSM